MRRTVLPVSRSRSRFLMAFSIASKAYSTIFEISLPTSPLSLENRDLRSRQKPHFPWYRIFNHGWFVSSGPTSRDWRYNRTPLLIIHSFAVDKFMLATSITVLSSSKATRSRLSENVTLDQVFAPQACREFKFNHSLDCFREGIFPHIPGAIIL